MENDTTGRDDVNFDRKRDRALALLARTGMMRSNYLPPTFPFLWRCGVRLPPPHFLSFVGVVLVTGLPFGVCWIGLCMLSFENGTLAVTTELLVFVLAIALPGTAFASYYASGRKRFRLPKWSDL